MERVDLVLSVPFLFQGEDDEGETCFLVLYTVTQRFELKGRSLWMDGRIKESCFDLNLVPDDEGDC